MISHYAQLTAFLRRPAAVGDVLGGVETRAHTRGLNSRLHSQAVAVSRKSSIIDESAISVNCATDILRPILVP